jgi:hypothetical protein
MEEIRNQKKKRESDQKKEKGEGHSPTGPHPGPNSAKPARASPAATRTVFLPLFYFFSFLSHH